MNDLTGSIDIKRNVPDAEFIADEAAENADREVIRQHAGNSVVYAALVRQVRRDLIRIYGPGNIPDANEAGAMATHLEVLSVASDGVAIGSSEAIREVVENLPWNGTFGQEHDRVANMTRLIGGMAACGEDELCGRRDGASYYFGAALAPPSLPTTADATAIALAAAVLRGDMVAAKPLADRVMELASE